MIFFREASAAVVLVTLTLSLQSAGLAAVIAWARPNFAPDVLRLGAIRSAILMMRLMTAFIVLHLWRFCFGRAFIAGFVFRHGNLPFTSRLPVMRPSAMAMSFFRGCGGPWVQWKASSAS